MTVHLLILLVVWLLLMAALLHFTGLVPMFGEPLPLGDPML